MMSENNNKSVAVGGDTEYDFMSNCKLADEIEKPKGSKKIKTVAEYQEIHPKIIEIDPHFAKEVERKITKFDIIQKQA